jgi:alkylhydroperoxidase family enzyme
MARLLSPDTASFPLELREFLAQVPRQAAFDILSHSVSTIRPFLLQGVAQFTALELPARSRELVILTTASMTGCDYEFVQHVPISESAGVHPSVRETIRRKDFQGSALSQHDRAIVTFVAEVVANPRVPDDVFAAVREYLSDREIVEVLQTTGFYWSFARVCTVLDVTVEEAQGTAVVEASRKLSTELRRVPTADR